MVAVTAVVVKRGPMGRPGLLSASALALAGVGVLALAPGVAVATIAALVLAWETGRSLPTSRR